MRPNELLWKREIGQKFSVTHWQDSTVTQVPRIVKEGPLNIMGSDKVFSSHWLNDIDILFGTKDQKVTSLSNQSVNALISLHIISVVMTLFTSCMFTT
jgi:hypothetical protein